MRILKHGIKKLYIHVLIFSLLFSMSANFLSVASASEEITPITFPFTHIGFPDKPTQPGWSLVGGLTDTPVVGYQSYGAGIGSTNVGQSRTFQFEVPEAGTYLVKFQGYLYYLGGIGELQVDGKSIGTYDFYAATSQYGSVSRMLDVELTQGTHELTLKTVGKSPESGSYRMFASQFIIERQELPAPATYPFTHIGFPDKPTLPGWSLMGGMTDTPVVGYQSYGALIGSTAVGQSRTFQFNVPEAGTYLIKFQGFQSAAGGIAELKVDGEVIGTYDFYGATSQYGPVSPTMDVELNQGMHQLTLRTVGKSEESTAYRMFASKLIVQKEVNLPSLVKLALNITNPLLYIGSKEQLQVTGTMSNGAKHHLDGAAKSYASSDSNVVTVDTVSGELTAAGVGAATVTASVYWNGVTKTASLPVVVNASEEITPITYPFTHIGFPDKPTRPGWSLVGGLTDTPVVGYQSYGAGIGTTTVGQSRTFHFDVPEAGTYRVKFQGYLSNLGGIAELQVDGKSIGTYDFYGASSQYGSVSRMLDVELTQGTHELTLKTVDKSPQSGSYRIFASQFIIERQVLPAPATYPFTHIGFPDQPTLPGWSLMGGMTDAPAVSYQSYGALIGSTAVGQSRTFQFNVPEAGTYLIKFQGFQSAAGGIAELKVDGEVIGTYDFYGAASQNGPVSPTMDVVLNQGMHQLTLRTVGKSEESTAYRMFASKLIVQKEVNLPSLVKLALNITTPLLYIGSKEQLQVTGTMSNGAKHHLDGAAKSYASSDSNVVTVDAASGELTATGVGAATVTASVYWNGVTKSASLPVHVNAVTNAKTRSTIYTPAKVTAARSNVATYEWAITEKNNVIQKADLFLNKGLDFLWNLVTPQSIYRSYAVNNAMGSPITGTAINEFGNYPYTFDPLNDPWKIVDPSSGYKFPTNDFGAYYQSGLDEHGLFVPERADRSLLVNTLYPEKGPTWGVDDGYGWVDQNGNRYTFIAYYNHWALWSYLDNGSIKTALDSLRDAYLYTGDVQYARAGTVLLDRIADIYPSLDISAFDSKIYLNSGPALGKALGAIWETFLVKDFLYAYDAFFPMMDDPDLIDFLSVKSQAYKLGPLKNSATGIRKNIEDGIVKQVYPGVKSAKIRGNIGMHQSALALAAVVYDKLPETKEWLDFDFQSGDILPSKQVTGGNINATFINDVDRDGIGDEASPGYNRLWLDAFLKTADILNGYDLYPGVDLYSNEKFRKMFSGVYQLLLSERYMPQIGDTASTGNPGNGYHVSEMIKAFEQYGDPIFAQFAFFLNNNTAGLHGDIFSANPDQVKQELQQVIDQYGTLDLKSQNMSGYGFAALRDGMSSKEKYGIVSAFQEMPVVHQTNITSVNDGYGALMFEAVGPEDWIAFSFEVPANEEYEVVLQPYRSLKYGIYNISIDGQLKQQVDFYGNSSELESIGNLQLTAGTHQITFDAVGKNPDSLGFGLGLLEMSLLDQQEQTRRDASVTDHTLRDLWLYYGRNTGHGHKDTLNLGLHAFGLDLAPDLGYPEFANSTDTHRFQWMENTISHNTVMVDKRMQQNQWVAEPKHYDDSEQVKLIDLEAPKVYPQTDLYKRTTAMIKVDDENSYAVDFFRVKGGSDHHFSFHGPEGFVNTSGLNTVPQQDINGDYTGTYAGTNIEYGQRPSVDSADGSNYMGPGFHYLKNVDRDNAPATQFSVDWDVVDTWKVFKNPQDIHLRLTMLGQLDDVALADGIPPQNKTGNPESLRYLIAHRNGTNLDSLFTSVIEPYKGSRYIQSISVATLEVNGTIVDNNEAKAIKVVLTNGRTDYIISSLNSNVTYLIDGRIQFKGLFGVYSEQAGQQVYGYVNEGTLIGLVNQPIVSATYAKLTGTVANFTPTLSHQNTISVNINETNFVTSQLVGSSIYIQNDGVRNAVYEIKGVTDLGGGQYQLDIGDFTLIRSYMNDNDFSQGYVYDIAVEDSFDIPLTHQ